MDKGTPKRSYTRHFVIVSVLVAIVGVLAVLGLLAIPKFPKASTQALTVDSMFDLHLMVIGFLFALVMVFMLYSLFVFRRKAGDDSDGDHFEGNTKLEITWTVVPLIVVLIFGVIGARTLRDVTEPKTGEMTVEVTAFSFGWQFNYPDLGVERATTLNLPVNQPVLFKLRSLDADVIHSFYVPEFRVKQDLVPGVPTQLRVTPNVVGQYKLRCNELCGTGHTTMLVDVNVTDQASFDSWAGQQRDALAAQAASAEARVALGKELHVSQGCNACHNVNGDPGGIGPTWKGVYEHEVELADGTTVIADEAYLKQSIVAPASQVVAGYNGALMPATYGSVLSEDQINAIIEYIKTLK